MMFALMFFTDDFGNPSMMRLMSFLCLVVVLAVVIGNTFFARPLDSSIVLMLLSFAFGGKVLQKQIEPKGMSGTTDAGNGNEQSGS